MSLCNRWRQWKINRLHAYALDFLCRHDGRPHKWDYDRRMKAPPESAFPGWCTPFGDVERCERCGDRRLVDVPSR